MSDDSALQYLLIEGPPSEIAFLRVLLREKLGYVDVPGSKRRMTGPNDCAAMQLRADAPFSSTADEPGTTRPASAPETPRP